MDSTGSYLHLSGCFIEPPHIEAGVRPSPTFLTGKPPEMKKDTVIRRRETPRAPRIAKKGYRLEQREELTPLLNTLKRSARIDNQVLESSIACYVPRNPGSSCSERGEATSRVYEIKETSRTPDLKTRTRCFLHTSR